MLKTCLSNLHSLCYFMISDYIYIYIYIYIYLYSLEAVAPHLFVDWVQLLQGYTKTLQGDSLLFTRNSCYSLDQSRKDEKLRWPWSDPAVLNLCINLVITKYRLKSQYVKLTQLWPLTVSKWVLSLIWQAYHKIVKNMFPLHICRPNDYTIEIIVLLQIQVCNIFTNVLSNIFKLFH